MAYKKGDYDTAIKYFDEALTLESDNEKKAQIAYAVAATLFNVKKLSQARGYLRKLSVSRKIMVMLISCLHSFMLPARIGMMRRL